MEDNYAASTKRGFPAASEDGSDFGLLGEYTKGQVGERGGVESTMGPTLNAKDEVECV